MTDADRIAYAIEPSGDRLAEKLDTQVIHLDEIRFKLDDQNQKLHALIDGVQALVQVQTCMLKTKEEKMKQRSSGPDPRFRPNPAGEPEDGFQISQF